MIRIVDASITWGGNWTFHRKMQAVERKDWRSYQGWHFDSWAHATFFLQELKKLNMLKRWCLKHFAFLCSSMLSKSRCKALLTRMPRSYPTHEHAFFLCMIMGVKSNWDFAILRRVLYPFCFLTKIPGPYRTFLEAPILGWIRGPNGSDLPLTVRCQAWHDSNSGCVLGLVQRRWEGEAVRSSSSGSCHAVSER